MMFLERWQKFMKKTDFAIFLNKYLTDYLVNTKGSSLKTINSYRYTFMYLLDYYTTMVGIPPEKLTIVDLTYERIVNFYKWLEEIKGNSPVTRNQRQSALHSFIKFLMYERPEYLSEYQRILGIPLKKVPQREISYLKTEGVKALMEQISLGKHNGLRDYTMLMLMYSTGIRVSELIEIKVRDVSLSPPCTLLVHGKGKKSRFVPLLSNTIPIIRQYLKAMKYDRPEKIDEWLFLNHMNEKFTRQGVSYLVRKYALLAKKEYPDLIPDDMSPHKMRHTAAMELVSSGVDLIYIRDLLGHVSVTTTEIYAKTDSKLKREAIEAASKEIVPVQEASWENNASLKEWLKNFCKSI